MTEDPIFTTADKLIKKSRPKTKLTSAEAGMIREHISVLRTIISAYPYNGAIDEYCMNLGIDGSADIIGGMDQAIVCMIDILGEAGDASSEV